MNKVLILFFVLATFNTTAQNTHAWAEEIMYDMRFEKDENKPEVLFAKLDNIKAKPVVSNYKTYINYLYQEANKGNLNIFDTDDMGRIDKAKPLNPEQLKENETRRDTIWVEDGKTGDFHPTYVSRRLKLKNYKGIYFTQHWAYNPMTQTIDVNHPNVLFAKEVIDELTGEFRGYMPVFYINQETKNTEHPKGSWSSMMHFGTYNGGNEHLQYLSAQGGKPYPVYVEQLSEKEDPTLIDELFRAMDTGKLNAYADEQCQSLLKTKELQKIFGQTNRVDVVNLEQNTREEHELYTVLSPAIIKGLRIKQYMFFDHTSKQLSSKITAVAFLNTEQQPLAWLKLEK